MSAGGNEVVVKRVNLPEEQSNARALLQLIFLFSAYASDVLRKDDTQQSSCNYLFWKLSCVSKNTSISGLLALTAT